MFDADCKALFSGKRLSVREKNPLRMRKGLFVFRKIVYTVFVIGCVSISLSPMKFSLTRCMMKFVYPAIIRKTEDGRFKATFPDLLYCEAYGDTVEDAVDNANDAARDWLEAELQEDVPDFPGVSEYQDMELTEGDIVRNIAVTVRFYVGWDE